MASCPKPSTGVRCDRVVGSMQPSVASEFRPLECRSFAILDSQVAAWLNNSNSGVLLSQVYAWVAIPVAHYKSSSFHR